MNQSKTAMISKNEFCKTSFYPPRDYNNTKDICLLTLNTIIAILNLALNLLVIYVITRTRQYTNKSVTLVLILSCSDVITAIVCQPLIVYVLYIDSFYTLSCKLSMIVQYVFYFSPYFSVFIIAFIVYDRYARITYTHRYDKFMTQRRFLFGLFIVVSATVVQDGIITIATLKESTELGGLAVLPFNILTLFFEIYFYAKTILKLNRYRNECKQKNFNTSAENSFTKLAAAYLFMIIICFTPFTVINTIYATYNKIDQSYHDIQYTWLMSQILYCFNSFANAVIFLRVNRKARITWRRMVRRLGSNGITNDAKRPQTYCVGMKNMSYSQNSFSTDINNNNTNNINKNNINKNNININRYRTISTQF